jgi:DNA-binding NarL/FixJ family response regulator
MRPLETSRRARADVPPLGEISIRIALVSSLQIERAGLRVLLASWPGVEVIGEADEPAKALDLVGREQPDVVLLDMDADAGGTPLQVTDLLAAGGGNTRILVLTNSRDVETHPRTVEAGASGLVLKTRAADELHKAIEKVYAGEVWLDRATAVQIIMLLGGGWGHPPATAVQIINHLSGGASEGRDPEAERIALLTEREKEVAHLICTGLKNREIAERLAITESTVRHHLTTIFGKLGVSTRFAMIIFLYRHHFAQPPT